MEARIWRIVVCALALASLGASYRTQNFIIEAATPQLAKEVGDMAEKYRHDLAIEWLGKPLPPWRDICPRGDICPIKVTAQEGLGAGGMTQFMFEGKRPFGWTMSIQGTRERILDSVLPHEITHTIFATHFGRPLPRWADEGACTTVEDISERKKQEKHLITFLTTNRGIAFNNMFAMTEYPQDVLPLYSQGYSLARFLIAQGGKQKFVKYVGEGMQTRNWTAATEKHYGFASLSELQTTWVEWVRQGSRDDDTEQFLLAHRGGRAHPNDAVKLASAQTTEKGTVAATPQKQAAPPATELVAAVDNQSRPQGGWYARKRDESRSVARLEPRATGTAVTALGAQPLNMTHENLPEAIQVGRPQPLSSVQPLILEKSRPPQSSTVPGKTVWR